MENLKKTCAEIKLDLIKCILEGNDTDCEKLLNKNKRITLEWLSPPFDGEILESEQRQEVTNRGNLFSNLLPDFFIDDLEKVFKRNMFSICFHIYFMIKDGVISLLIRFNNDEINVSPVKFNKNDVVYELIGTKLNNLTNYRLAEKYINEFEAYFNVEQKPQNFVFTQYITFHMKNIVEHFYGFEARTRLIVGAKQDQDNYRLNLVLDIDKSLCKNSTLSNGSRSYYNIGNMHP